MYFFPFIKDRITNVHIHCDLRGKACSNKKLHQRWSVILIYFTHLEDCFSIQVDSLAYQILRTKCIKKKLLEATCCCRYTKKSNGKEFVHTV